MPPSNVLHPIIIDNANPSRITATAGTHIGKGFFFGYIIFLANKRTLQFID